MNPEFFRKAYLLAIACLIVTFHGASGAPITLDQAHLAAQHFVLERVSRAPQAGVSSLAVATNRAVLSVRAVELWLVEGQEIGYIAHLDPAGYVLVRADDEIPPVKIYSDHSLFSDLPPNFIKVIALELREELQGVAELHAQGTSPDPACHRQWSGLLKAASAPGAGVSADPGAILVGTRWNQDSPYNLYCPAAAGGPGGRAYAGCVACAMAQILRYYELPMHVRQDHTYTDNSGACRGSHSIHDVGLGNYAWNNMPAEITAGSESAIAQLMYHCAVAVNSDFEAEETSAYPTRVPEAFRDYFYYLTTQLYERLYHYSTSEWLQKIQTDINKNYPVFYSLYPADYSSGHAMVCDGYYGNDIHLNMGWSGNSDAWYDLNSAILGRWTLHGAVFDIHPTPPIPYILVNGSREQTVDSHTPVIVTVALNADCYAGALSDWWALVKAAKAGESWWYCLYPSGWNYLPDFGYLRPAYQGPLQDIPGYSDFTILSLPSLPPATYVFYFGVDTMNGVLDNNVFYTYATLIVYISAPTGVSASDGTYKDKVRVTWDALSYATGYEVWRNTYNDTSPATKLADTTDTFYDDYSADVCTYYYYWIKAKDSAGYASSFSGSDSGYRRSLVLAWGNNYDGGRTVPTDTESGISAIAAGSYHSLALRP